MRNSKTTPIVDSLHDRFPFSVSTDNAGLFGNPSSAIKFWESATQQVTGTPLDFGLELLAWRHLPIVEVIHTSPVRSRLAGLHGRIGTRIESDGTALEQAFLKKKIALYNSVLHRSVPLLNKLTTGTEEWPNKPYLLLHEPEVEMLLQTNALSHTPKAIPIGVENSIDDPKLEKTRAAVAGLQELGFEAVVVFDLAHYLTCHGELDTPEKAWKHLIAQFAEQMMVHIPIGWNVSDSLNFDKTTPAMLAELAAAVTETQSYCTLEYQLAGIWPLYAQPSYLPSVRAYAAQWLEKLLAAKVITTA